MARPGLKPRDLAYRANTLTTELLSFSYMWILVIFPEFLHVGKNIHFYGELKKFTAQCVLSIKYLGCDAGGGGGGGVNAISFYCMVG